jgi:hypothetical protein
LHKPQRCKSRRASESSNVINTESQPQCLDIIRTFFEITAGIPDAREAILYISGLEKEQQEFEKLR